MENGSRSVIEIRFMGDDLDGQIEQKLKQMSLPLVVTFAFVL